jgi:hypothetical protein
MEHYAPDAHDDGRARDMNRAGRFVERLTKVVELAQERRNRGGLARVDWRPFGH